MGWEREHRTPQAEGSIMGWMLRATLTGRCTTPNLNHRHVRLFRARFLLFSLTSCAHLGNSHHQASPIQPPSNDAWYDFLAITNPAPIGAFPSGLPGSAHPSPVSILHPQGASSFRGQSALYSGGPNPLATDAPTSSALRSPRTDARAPRTTSRRRHTAASVTPTVSQSGAAISTNVSWERGGGSANGGKGAAAPKAPSRPSTTGPTPAVAELAAEALADSVLALTSLASSGGKRAEESDEAKPKAKGSEEGKDSAGT